MTEQENQWILSLSLVSLMGPRCDVDLLMLKGFYKKGQQLDDLLERNIYLERDTFSAYKDGAHMFLEALGVTDARSFEKKMDQLIDGSEFATNMERMLQFGRMMDEESRHQKRTIIVNDHPYLYELFETLMSFEFHWPANGLKAYELANAVMLLRLGVDLEYIDTARQGYYFEDIHLRVEKIFIDYKTYGQEAVIGGIIHSKYLEMISNGKIDVKWDEVLSIAYYSIWQHYEEMQIV